MYRRCIWLFVVALIATACSSQGSPSSEFQERVSELRGELIFSDDFNRSSVGQNWERGKGERGSGDWRIKDGWLYGHDLKNDPLWLTKKIPKNVVVEFDVQALSSLGDIKFEIFGDGRTHASGYIGILGGWENQLDVIARLDEHGDDRREKETIGVMLRTTYHFTIWRNGDKLRWFVGDKNILNYPDESPLRGDGHRYFAFNVWSAPVRFDNLEIYRISSSSDAESDG